MRTDHFRLTKYVVAYKQRYSAANGIPIANVKVVDVSCYNSDGSLQTLGVPEGVRRRRALMGSSGSEVGSSAHRRMQQYGGYDDDFESLIVITNQVTEQAAEKLRKQTTTPPNLEDAMLAALLTVAAGVDIASVAVTKAPAPPTPPPPAPKPDAPELFTNPGAGKCPGTGALDAIMSTPASSEGYEGERQNSVRARSPSHLPTSQPASQQPAAQPLMQER